MSSLDLQSAARSSHDADVQKPISLRLSLPFPSAVSVLMEALGLALQARTAFEARIRQLQRHGVPIRDARDPRLIYGIAELAAFATATKLMDAFMVPALAARYVTEKLEALGDFALAGAIEALPKGYVARRTISTDHFAVFGAHALAQMGQRHRHDARYIAPLGMVQIVSASGIADVLSQAEGAAIILDARTYMPVIVNRWTELTGATAAETGLELDRLRYFE